MKIDWQQFGLRTNPYDILPLVEGGDLSLEDAFIGRAKERNFLDDIFESEDRTCLTICGETGVGKTSLANVHKYVWKYKKKKLLFSCRRGLCISRQIGGRRSCGVCQSRLCGKPCRKRKSRPAGYQPSVF